MATFEYALSSEIYIGTDQPLPPYEVWVNPDTSTLSYYYNGGWYPSLSGGGEIYSGQFATMYSESVTYNQSWRNFSMWNEFPNIGDTMVSILVSARSTIEPIPSGWQILSQEIHNGTSVTILYIDSYTGTESNTWLWPIETPSDYMDENVLYNIRLVGYNNVTLGITPITVTEGFIHSSYDTSNWLWRQKVKWTAPNYSLPLRLQFVAMTGMAHQYYAVDGMFDIPSGHIGYWSTLLAGDFRPYISDHYLRNGKVFNGERFLDVTVPKATTIFPTAYSFSIGANVS
jgi:hypothetical protein